MFCPVSQRASLLTTNATTSAMSWAVPNRLKGDICAQALSDVRIGEHLRIGKPRRHGVHSHALHRQLMRQPFRELFQRAFAPQIDRCTGESHVSHLCPIGQDVDDPASVFDHFRSLLHCEVGAFGIQCKKAVILFFRCVDQRFSCERACC